MSKTITPDEVAQHKTAESGMYIIIDDGVYDVTGFVDEHPGGSKILKRAAGKNASKQFWKVRFARLSSTEMERHGREMGFCAEKINS